MDNPGRQPADHRIPSWVDPAASDYFITVCCQERATNQLCTPVVGQALLASVRFYTDQRKWFPELFLLMPDHLHMIVSFGLDQDLHRMVTAWKRYTARQHGIVWQRDFFEHRLRSNESAEEKYQYVLNSPVRAGLASEPVAWPYMLANR